MIENFTIKIELCLRQQLRLTASENKNKNFQNKCGVKIYANDQFNGNDAGIHHGENIRFIQHRKNMAEKKLMKKQRILSN